MSVAKVSREDVSVTQPLGPESLTWRYFGAWIGFAGGSVPQLYQLMHPVLGHAVEEHSNYKEDPFDRLLRSMGPIYGVVYDGPEAEATALAVRGFHRHIKGTMPDGERYSGLNPEVFHWAHATFVHGLIYGFSDIFGPFSRADQEQLYAESRQWYQLYGMTMRDVPETLDEFDAYWQHYQRDVLQATPAARTLHAIFRSPPPPPGLEWIPAPLWRPLGLVGGHLAMAFAAGQLSPEAREKLEFPWGRHRRLEYHLMFRLVRAVGRTTPPHRRFHPRAAAGWRREAASRGVTVADLFRRVGVVAAE